MAHIEPQNEDQQPLQPSAPAADPVTTASGNGNGSGGDDYDATPVTICFNAQYVLDFLNVADTDSVGLEFKDEMSQAVMKPIGADGYDYTYVIMPIRV